MSNLARYEKLKISLRYYFQGAKFHRAGDALEFAATYHKGTRKDGVTPEFQHQIEICQYLRTLEPFFIYPEDVYIAALLHDTKEDYGLLSSVTDTRFGTRPSTAIDRLDKSNKPIEVYFFDIASDPIASLVKGADRINNVQSMVGVFSLEKQQKYIYEVEEYFIPMLKTARRLFVQQEPAYQNMLHMLRSQLQFLAHLHNTQPST